MMDLGGLVKRVETKNFLNQLHGSYSEKNVWVCQHELKAEAFEHQCSAG